MNRTYLTAVPLLGLLLSVAPRSASDEASYLDPEESIIVHAPGDSPCPDGVLLWHYNPPGLEYVGGFTWHYDGVAPPDYGAFAEGYSGSGTVCGIRLLLTTLPGSYQGQTLDAYVYDGAGANPGAVLSLTPDIAVTPPGLFPTLTEHDLDVADVVLDGGFFVGFWPDWPGAPCGWWIVGDLGGPGGCPRTKIAPGIGYPEGWQDPSIVWGPIRALGIGAYLAPLPVPTHASTWGEIKALFR